MTSLKSPNHVFIPLFRKLTSVCNTSLMKFCREANGNGIKLSTYSANTAVAGNLRHAGSFRIKGIVTSLRAQVSSGRICAVGARVAMEHTGKGFCNRLVIAEIGTAATVNASSRYVRETARCTQCSVRTVPWNDTTEFGNLWEHQQRRSGRYAFTN